jgi:SAM-dependent methyltransferase
MTEAEENPGHTLRVDMDLELAGSAAFDTLVGELEGALNDAGIRFEAGPEGRITEGETEVGRVVSWETGKRIVFRWTQASWNPEEVTEVEIRCEESKTGTHVTLEHRRWGRLLGEGSEVAGWLAGTVLAPLMKAMAPGQLGDWITDRRARRPSGSRASSFYRDPLYHYPGFRALLAELALTPEDRLLEVGCGGGVLLKQALASGCSGTGVDHSPEMVRLAREVNGDLLRAGKLEILEGSAERLPFRESSFTCATMSGVFGFISNPVAALEELRRVLRAGGRIVLLGTDPSMRGTPAAPEPMASRLHFYDDKELEGLARTAGFRDVRVVRRSLETFAREAGIPQEHMPLFEGTGTPLLIARKT